MTPTPTGYGKEYRALRPCKQCGFDRLVKVTPILSGELLVDEIVSGTCTACQLDNQAARYEGLAAKMRIRANGLRSRRDK